ncbi:hypothetical protein [Bradyrhizobium sp.]|uniref:hypothetical protein n=1 Tax=Bradyrhizobium sp. TaxID=376 RepID=UPI003C567722
MSLSLAHMNQLNVGLKRTLRPQGRAIHSFNPLKEIDKRKAQELAELVYTIYPEGQQTLTVRKGKWELAPALLAAKSLDQVQGSEEVNGVMGDLLFNPLVRNCLCGKKQFVFDERRVILARLNRKDIGEKAALTIGLFLIGQYGGQLVIPDFGFYGRDVHSNLIRENRLIAGVNFLDELTPKLRQSVLLIPQKIGCGATFDDAEALVSYAKLLRGTNEYNDFVHAAMG